LRLIYDIALQEILKNGTTFMPSRKKLNLYIQGYIWQSNCSTPMLMQQIKKAVKYDMLKSFLEFG